MNIYLGEANSKIGGIGQIVEIDESVLVKKVSSR